MFWASVGLGLILNLVSSVNCIEKCNQAIERVLENNSPQALVIPDEDEANAFTSSQVRISISWAHIDDNLFDVGQKGKFDSYFIEYSASTGLDKPPVDHVLHSPVIHTTQHSLTIPDDCQMYSIVLGVVLKLNNDTEDCSKILYSRPKLIWPAARHTNVNVYSNRAEFFWPPGCNHLILPSWQMESCSTVSPDEVQSCRRDSLHAAGHSSGKYEVTNLDPCQLWHFRLRAPPSVVKGVIELGSVLWTFEANTVPIPHIQAIAGYDYLRLILDQSKCSTEAVISDWRVTVCDDWSQNNETNHCRNALHRLAFFNRQKHVSRGYLEVRPLKDCQLYTVAISPATADGNPVLPGEKYTSIHSTLCAPPPPSDEDQLQPHMGSKSSNSELVVVLITMILIGSAMLCLALKSVTSLGSSKNYYNPANYDDQYVLESMNK